VRVGKLVVPVEVTDRVAPGVVSLPHGWGHDLAGMQLGVAARRPGVSKTVVVDDTDLDVPSGTSVLNGIPVELSVVE
jgi:anaerobic selenocysteine-containing dehydrogenase